MTSKLQVQQFGSMKDDFRGAFTTGDADWSWGQWESGEFWAECIEAYGADESLYGKNFEADSLAALFGAVRDAAGTDWTHAVVTDDWGKRKSVKL